MLVVAGDHRGLQRRDHVRVVHVVLATVHVLQQAALVDRLTGVPGARGELFHVGLEVREVSSLNAALRAGEAQVDHLVRQAHDLEQLRAAVAADGRDTHLGHDLEQALADPRPVTSAQFEAGREIELHSAFAHHVEQDLIRHVRIHGGCAVADEAREMMRVARSSGLDQEVALAAQSHLHQMMVNGAGDEQRVRR